MNRLLFLLLLSVLAVTLQPGLNAAQPASYQAANDLYAKGDFQAARDAYTSLVKEGHRSANLFYNLGNTHYRLGEKAQAFVAWERALALEPAHPEALANLTLLRKETGARVETPGWKERALLWPQIATGRRASWLAAATFWAMLFCLSPLLWRGRPAWISGAALLLVTGWAAASAGRDAWLGPVWIVTEANATAREAPLDTAKRAATLPLGSEVRLRHDRGPWVSVRLPDASQAWISRKALEPVALEEKQG